MDLLVVREIKAVDTLSIRQKILRPQFKPIECIFPGDNELSTHHFGAFIGNELVGIVSLFEQLSEKIDVANGMQIRAMATLDEYRGQGIGLKLLQTLEMYAFEHNVEYLWANARIVAKDFYRKAGYQVSDDTFDIKGVGMHVLIRKNKT